MQEYNTLSMVMEKGVARINLNRPDKANSLNGTMWKELKNAFDELDRADDVRAVVLGGRGKHFSTGIDLGYLTSIQQDLVDLHEGRRQEHLRAVIENLQKSVMAIETCRKPVLAAIQGFCMGAGVDIAAACDMRYATESTRFSVKEVDLAIVADLGTLQRLPGIVGEGIARELSFTGRTFKGKEALAIGFVNQLYKTGDELESETIRIAGGLTEKSPLTLRGIKEVMNYSRDHSVVEGLSHVAQRNAAMLLSKDLEEAVGSFFDKRAPRYDD